MNKLVIKRDSLDDRESPREWENLGTMFCYHNSYNLGDVQKKYPLANSWEENFFLHIRETFDLPENFTYKQISNWVEKNIIWEPLYLYDHSGITISTTPFQCRWDSGQVGYIYVTKDKVREERGIKRISSQVTELIEQILKGEVEVYDAYLRGEIYYYEIQDEEGDTLDSLGGIYYTGDQNTFVNEVIENLFGQEYFPENKLHEIVTNAFHGN